MAGRSAKWLASELDITQGLAASWVDLAKLGVFLDDCSVDCPTGTTTDMLFLLQRCNIGSRSQLRQELNGGSKAFASKLVDAALDFAVVTPVDQTLEAWKGALLSRAGRSCPW